MHDVIKNKQLEMFAFDLENLASISFTNSEYEINQRAIILRKFLIDGHGVVGISNLLQREKITFLSINAVSTFEDSYLVDVKIFLPVLNILPIISISCYSAIKLPNLDATKKKGCDVQTKEVATSLVDLNKYLNEPYAVLDGEYLSRKEIIEYICYGKGAVHYGIDKNKIDRLGKITKLNFYYAMGEAEPDAAFSWLTSFHTPDLEKQFLDTPELATFMMQLGEKHSFQTLVQLQITFELMNSQAILAVYQLAKQYLVANDPKFRKFDPSKLFSTQA